MSDWLAEVRERVTRTPFIEMRQIAMLDAQKLLACAEALAELVALRDQQLAHHWKADAAWERARAALRGEA